MPAGADELFQLVALRDQLADHDAALLPVDELAKRARRLEGLLPDVESLVELGVRDHERDSTRMQFE